MIPSVVHWIWIGDRPLPDIAVDCMNSVSDRAGDFTFVLHAENPDVCQRGKWTLEKLDLATLPSAFIMDRLRRYMTTETRLGAASDVARIDLLERFGGLYLDIDVFAVRAFDSLALDVRSLLQGEEWGGRICGNYLLGASRGHPALGVYRAAIAAKIEQLILEGDTRRLGNPVAVTGPGVAEKVLARYPDRAILPWRVSSHWNPYVAPSPDVLTYDFPEPIVLLHLFASSWVPGAHRFRKRSGTCDEAIRFSNEIWPINQSVLES